MNILDKRASNPAAALDGTELVYVAQLGADAVTTVQDIKDFATNGFLLITTAASTYVAKNAPITGATKTKITYNTDGLITSGADATTADIADSPDRRYITDAQQTVLNNTSNTNSGDETTATIKTKLGAASSTADGYLTSTDWNTFDSKLKTINHTSAGTITLVPGYKVTQIISTAATMTLTGGVATDQSEIVRIIARADTVISLSGAILGFADGHTLNNIGTTYTVYKGETIDLYMPAANAFYVHGQHIQDSGSLAIYKPGTNYKITYDLSALNSDRVITVPNQNIDLGAPYVSFFSSWYYGFDLASTAQIGGTTVGGVTSPVIDFKDIGIVQDVIGSTARTHSVGMPSARYSIAAAVAADLTITGLIAPNFIEVVSTAATNTVKLTRAGTTTYLTDWSTSWGTVTAGAFTFSLGIGEKLFVHPAQSSTSCRVSRSGDIVVYPDDRTVNSRSRFIAPVAFTANRTITVPNADVDLGKLTNSTVAPSNITVTASPFTYQNTTAFNGEVIISGGTVSSIEFTRDNTTFYTTGLTTGVITLSPSDRVRVTYSVAPTMTLVPR